MTAVHPSQPIGTVQRLTVPALLAERAKIDAMPRRVAVIDIGSNSGRVVVLEEGEFGALDVVDEMRAPLRLARQIDHEGRFTARAFDTVLEAVGDFIAIARGQGAEEIHTVGTFAMRVAANGGVLAEVVRQRFGVTVEVLDGDTEARFGFAGAAYGIDATDGLCVDIGGGSLQVTRFRARRAEEHWTFPFGALRLTDRFIATDPPKTAELRTLRREVRAALREAGVPHLGAAEMLVGTGGTIRNLAKLDLRRRTYPVRRLHGYELERARLRRAISTLSALPLARRAAVPGLTSGRADSIVAGAVALDAVMGLVGADNLTVSGQGLREGVVRGALHDVLPDAIAVRRSSVRTLCRRFSRWSAPHAQRRARTALALFDVLALNADPLLREALEHAAQVIDVGATIDVYNRHERSAEVVLESDLQGFPHRLLVATAALLRLAERPGASMKAYRPLIDDISPVWLEATATVLALADEIERRWPNGDEREAIVTAAEGVVRVIAPVSPWWRPSDVVDRVRRAFDRDLLIEGLA
ncbi:MAG: Ppx/GppA phosphatase family protein [Chloroflexi bacterium]|nr:Ppx/GppA phosphatase family protein [Chloroflexota bacterium]MDA1239579.1 Ppx/GppA phosphatase family protein [Chloroflexota bacterium]